MTTELKGSIGELRFEVEVRDKHGNLKHRGTFAGAATPEQAQALGATFVDPQPTQEPSNGSNPLDGGA